MAGARPPHSHPRYLGLDLFRGIAAMMVLIGHIHSYYPGLPNPGSSYLAVDLFFLLSGFVIAGAYDRRFDSGWDTSNFLIVRLIRLYPLLLVGLSIGALRRTIQLWAGANPVPLPQIVVNVVCGLFMLPAPAIFGSNGGSYFPLDDPAWSLFFELVVNAIYALSYRRLTQRMLVAIIAASGAGLLVVIPIEGRHFTGPDWIYFASGFLRASFSFFFGILLYRSHLRVPQVDDLTALFLSAALLAFLSFEPGPATALYRIAMGFIVFPAMVALGSVAVPGKSLSRVCWQAGAVSYAVYIVHMPVMQFLHVSLLRLNPHWEKLPLSGFLAVSVFVAVCFLLDRFYDMPLRRWLTRRLVA